jgi:hypothetical protein
MRSIAGNGSLRLNGIYKPLIDYITPRQMEEPEEALECKKITIKTFIDPLKLLFQKDVLANLIFGGIVFAIWSMVTSSTTGLFKSLFLLNDLQVGLAFLPNGEFVS